MNNLVKKTSRNLKNIQVVPSSTNNENSASKDTFVRAIAPVIRFVQCFGLLPVRNCFSKDRDATKFKWTSIPTIITMFSAALISIQLGLYIRVLFQTNIGLDELDSLIFSIVTISEQFCLLRIAMNWDTFMTQWCETERIFLRSPYKRQKFSLRLKLQIFSWTFLFLGLVQECLLTAKIFYSTKILMDVCHLEPDYLKYTFKIIDPSIYAYFGYNHFIGIIANYINLSMDMCIYFTNLVTILISFAIAERFKQFNGRLASACYQHVPESFWTECRLHHQKLTNLVNLVNKYFGPLILIVSFGGIYFVSRLILDSGNAHLPFFMDKLYFVYSILFVPISLYLTFSSAARVNDLSKKSLSVLSTVPKESWNNEAKRFMWQLQYDFVALSGCNLFSITKGLMLRLAGAIFTYEIILFDNINIPTPAEPDIIQVCALLRDN